MTRYLPIALGALLIVVLTIPQFRMTDRLSGTNVTAEQQAELLKNVPIKIGNWHGEDIPIDENVRETAGAVGAISRNYHNVRTGENVDLWLIVGHGGVIARHTPDVCYRSSGFTARADENSLYPMVFAGQQEAPFLTNTFFKEDVTGRRIIRVFWTWYNSEDDKDPSTVEWEAPSNSRRHFGNTRALYKMYFTSEMRDASETAEESACLRFARDFLPVVNKALSQVYSDSDSKPSEAAGNDATDAESKATEAAPNEPAVEESEPVEDLQGSAEEAVDKLLEETSAETPSIPASEPADATTPQ